jgi:hypothetical protein
VSRRLGPAGDVVDSVTLASSSGLNRRDAENFQRGYYENLLDVDKFDDELRRRYQQMPDDFVRSLSRLGLTHSTKDAQDYELLPQRSGRFVGAMVSTNRWGMRDKERSLARPADTYRMALLGPSTAMGSGVEANDTFEAVLEDRLNREAAPSHHYEVLNFGVAGYAPLHVLYQLERKVFPFQPQAVLYLGHASDIDRTSTQFVRMVRKQVIPPTDTFLQELEDRTGIVSGTGPNEARRRMKPYTLDLTRWVYRRIVEDCRRHGTEPVFVYLETVTDPMEPWRAEQRTAVLRLAREAGFRIVDLTGVWNGYQPSELWIRQNDGHANVLGNRLIADRLYQLLTDRPDVQLASLR